MGNGFLVAKQLILTCYHVLSRNLTLDQIRQHLEAKNYYYAVFGNERIPLCSRLHPFQQPIDAYSVRSLDAPKAKQPKLSKVEGRKLPWRIGYPCINWKKSLSTSHTFRINSHSEKRFKDTVTLNIEHLKKILAYNIKHNIRFFRIGSPVCTHPISSTNSS
jgi:hypothetical protein